jgi:hypothetical protein
MLVLNSLCLQQKDPPPVTKGSELQSMVETSWVTCMLLLLLKNIHGKFSDDQFRAATMLKQPTYHIAKEKTTNVPGI